MAKLFSKFNYVQLDLPGLEVTVINELGGISCRALEFSIYVEFFKRWQLDFDFLINLGVGRMHHAPNNDTHAGSAAGCTRWPCVADADEIPL